MASRYQEIESLGIKVVAISFGTDYWARAWLNETQAPFPLLLDPERDAYRAYGLEESALRSWSPKNILYYLRAILFEKRELHGYRGDPHQLGGDFVVDQQGIIRLAHPSRDPTDRPDVARVMEVLGALTTAERSVNG